MFANRSKKFRTLSFQPGLHGINDLRVGQKMATFQLFFQSMKQVVVRRGQIWRIWWVIKTLETQVGQYILGRKCPVSRGIVVQEQELLGDLPAALFLQNDLQLHQQRCVILRVDSLTLWKIINEDHAVLMPKIKARIFQRIFALELFGTEWAAMPPLHWLLLCLRVMVIKPGFVHGHQSRREITWIAPKKIPKVAQKTCTTDVFDPCSSTSGSTSRRASACPNFHELWTQPAHVRFPVAQLMI